LKNHFLPLRETVERLFFIHLEVGFTLAQTEHAKKISMKKQLFVVIFLLIIFNARGNTLYDLNDERVVGRNFTTDTDIIGVEYKFPENIFEYHRDPATGFLTLHLRKISKKGRVSNRGKLIHFDLENRETKWVKKVNYREIDLFQVNDIIIQGSSFRKSRLDINTGKILWEVFNDFRIIDHNHNIAIGYWYKEREGYTNTLQGVNLNNGRLLWVRDLNREFEWNNAHYLNDSIILLVANGLSTINIKNGSGWNFEAVTGNKDYTATAILNVAGVTLGLFTGMFVFFGGYNLAADLVSNVIIDSSDLYLASKENLSRVNRITGKKVWSTGLSKDLQSTSAIFMNDSLIFLVNRGYAFNGRRFIYYGKPFIAAYSKDTGEEKYYTVIPGHRIRINMIFIKDDALYLILEDKISKYSLENGSRISEKAYNASEFDGLRGININKAFIRISDSEFENLASHGPDRYYVHSTKRMLLGIDEVLNIDRIYPMEDIYVNYLEANGFRFLVNDGKTTIIDSDNQKIAELPFINKATIIGDKLYGFEGTSLFEINLEDIVGGN
jgi:hypothetical protein